MPFLMHLLGQIIQLKETVTNDDFKNLIKDMTIIITKVFTTNELDNIVNYN